MSKSKNIKRNKITALCTFFILTWFCFNLQGGSRPHVIFAKNEVRVTVFDDGNRGKDLPTGFSAEVEGMNIIKTILYVLT